MKRRSKEQKIEWAAKKTRILDLFNADGNWRQLANQLSVPQPTAYRWIQEGKKPDMRGGVYNSKVTAEHRDAMCNLIEQNPRITLAQLTDKLFTLYSLVVSKTTVLRHLDALTYTLKQVRFEPERANTLENKKKRKEFAQRLLAFQGQNIPILFMDESNFNIHISRSEGRSARGTRCSVAAAGSKGANVHMIGCIGSLGLIHFEMRRGAFHKEDACDWLRMCFRKAYSLYRKPVVLVLDNAPCHSRVEDVLLEEEFRNHFILRLAPYSPMLNPIEQVWSVMKSDVKRNLAENISALLNDELRGQLTIKEYRLQFLERYILNAVETVVPGLCCSCIAHIQGKLPDALALEDVEY